MARLTRRPPATRYEYLVPEQQTCWQCGGPLWAAWHRQRTITTLDGVLALKLQVRRCVTATCPAYHRPYRPEAEGSVALPHHEFGCDVIALAGRLRGIECRSVPEIHQLLTARGVAIAERTVPHLLARYEELLALHLSDGTAAAATLRAQGAVVLALDGMQPDVGHEVLWVVREVLSGTVLLARTLLGATVAELVTLLTDVCARLPAEVPVRGVVSDGQQSIRQAVRLALPGVPHQLCHFHYLREAAQPIFEADRHAKKELKKRVRGVRPLERMLEGRTDATAEALRGYCLAVRSALTDDGRPPLAANGLVLHERLTAITRSLQQVTAALTAAGGEKHAVTHAADRAAEARPRRHGHAVAADPTRLRLGPSRGATAGSTRGHAGRAGATPPAGAAPRHDTLAAQRRATRRRGRTLLRRDAALPGGAVPLL